MTSRSARGGSVGPKLHRITSEEADELLAQDFKAISATTTSTTATWKPSKRACCLYHPPYFNEDSQPVWVRLTHFSAVRLLGFFCCLGLVYSRLVYEAIGLVLLHQGMAPRHPVPAILRVGNQVQMGHSRLYGEPRGKSAVFHSASRRSHVAEDSRRSGMHARCPVLF
jgi:hypothetical protein